MTSSTSVPSDLASILDEIAAIAERLGDRAVAQSAQAAHTHKQSARLQLRIVGPAGSGRASLVNALLGADIVPVSAIPKAPLGLTIRYGDASSVTRVTPEGDRIAVPRTQLRGLLFDPETVSGSVEIEAPLEPLELCDIHVEALEVERSADAWRDLLAASDYVIVVLNASALLSDAERRFVRDQVAPRFGLERVAFLVNHMDLVPEEERESILELVQTFLGPFRSQPAVLDVSLRDITRSGTGREAIATLLDDLLVRREPMRAEGLQHTAALLLDQLSATATRLEALYSLEAEDVEQARDRIAGQQDWLDQRVERTQRRIRAWVETLLREKLQRRIESFAASLRNRLPDEIRSVGDTATVRRHLPGYIEAVWADFLRGQVLALRGELATEETRVAEMIDADFRELLAAVGQPALQAQWDLGSDPGAFNVFVMPRRARRRSESIARALAFNGLFMLLFSPPLGVLSLLAGQVVQRINRADLAEAEAEALTTSAEAAVRQVEGEVKRRMDKQFTDLARQLESDVADVYRRGTEGLLALLDERAAHAEDLMARRQEIHAIAQGRLPALRASVGWVQADGQP